MPVFVGNVLAGNADTIFYSTGGSRKFIGRSNGTYGFATTPYEASLQSDHWITEGAVDEPGLDPFVDIGAQNIQLDPSEGAPFIDTGHVTDSEIGADQGRVAGPPPTPVGKTLPRGIGRGIG